MRPIKLEIEGLHSFESCQVIDFSALSANGIFGVFGATGSGKSTILDAIILALYGKVQRSKTNSDFINLKSKKAVVAFEFSFAEDGKEKVYKVQRVFKRRPKNNQEVEQIAEIFEISAIGSKQIIEGVSKVDKFIEGLLGMGDAEFLKCIALPQGEFASFLKSKPNERVAIIGNIFDLNKYGQELWEKVRTKTDVLERDLAVIEGKIAVVGEFNDEELRALRAEYATINKEVINKTKKMENLKKTVGEEQEIARLGAELEEVQKSIKKYSEMTSSVLVKKKALTKAKKLSANKYVFDRQAELMSVILKDEDELRKKNVSLDTAKINSQEYFCNTILELEGLKSNSRKSIEKLERLKALKDVEARSMFLSEKMKALSADIQILENKSSHAEKKLLDKRTSKALAVNELAEVDAELLDLKDQLKGYGSVVAYKSLSEFIVELKQYQEFTEQKYEETVGLLTTSISSQDKLTKDKDDVVGEIKALYKKFNVKGVLGEGKLIAGLNRAQDEYREFSKLVGEVETVVETKKLKEREIRNLQEQVDRLEIDKVRLDIKVQDFEKEISKVKSDILRLKATRDKALVDNGITNVVDKLRIGDECPICKSEILEKTSRFGIDEVVVENSIIETNEILERKIEARDNCLFAIAKIVAEMEGVRERMGRLTNEISEHNITIKNKLGVSDLLDSYDEIDAAIKSKENTFLTNVENYVKSVNEEKHLYSKLREIEYGLTKQTCINAATRMEMSVLGELLENLSSSIKSKDLELLGLVSENEEVGEKLKKLEALNRQLDETLGKREKVADSVMNIDAEISKAEIELATMLNEKLALEKQVKEFKDEYKENAIILKSETIGGKVDYTIKLEEEELESYRHRETEILNTREELKNVVYQLETELNNLNAINKTHNEEYNNLKQNINEILDELKLEDVEEAKLFMLDESEIKLLENVVDNHEDNLKIAETKKVELEGLLSGRVSSPVIVEQMQEQIGFIETEIKSLNEKSIKLKYELGLLEEKSDVVNSLKKEYDKLATDYNLHKELYDLLKGKALLEFIAEEFIDDISFMASSKLQVLMDGRYVLKYDNKEFYVVDNFNDASVRPVSTLSGGEIFVVSLALALSISDAIASKSNKNIDFFFLDEGFGTLDKEYCEYIVDSLIKLESQNITIGLISHIPELQERIPHKLEVVKTSKGSVVKLKHDI